MLMAAALFAAALQTKGTASPAAPQNSTAPGVAGTTPQAQPVATEDDVKARCSVCHKLPSPDILPRSAWRDEIVRMMLIQEGVPEPAGASGLLPLPPDWLRLWRYYDAKAPDKLPEPEPWPAASNAPVRFEKQPVAGVG